MTPSRTETRTETGTETAQQTDVGHRDRPTLEVLSDHLRCRAMGAVEEDLARNYDEEVVVVVGGAARRGHDAVRDLARELHASEGQPTFEYLHRVVEGDIAYVVWRTKWAGVYVHDGTETYICRGGRIVSHTVYYSLTADSASGSSPVRGWRALRDADAGRW